MGRFQIEPTDEARLLSALTAISAIIVAPLMLIWRFSHSRGADSFNRNDLGDFLGLARLAETGMGEPGFDMPQAWSPLAQAIQPLLSLDMAVIALLSGLALMTLASLLLDWLPGVLPTRDNA